MMELDFNEIAAALNEWERIGAKGPVYDAAREVLDAPRMWWCGRYDIYSAEQSCNLDGLTAALHPDCGWVRIVKEDN